ncbi:hypothetical protein [Actinophytocola xinjiangensis]|uniref:hypothetical protein n=1 Tax=Actinophytocola xinjiangensis TaxID=485602 RepID=UPI0012B91BC7|nr:hypothetical protein [Actinophytocola xinjiangensis]
MAVVVENNSTTSTLIVNVDTTNIPLGMGLLMMDDAAESPASSVAESRTPAMHWRSAGPPAIAGPGTVTGSRHPGDSGNTPRLSGTAARAFRLAGNGNTVPVRTSGQPPLRHAHTVRYL